MRVAGRGPRLVFLECRFLTLSSLRMCFPRSSWAEISASSLEFDSCSLREGPVLWPDGPSYLRGNDERPLRLQRKRV